MLRPPCGFIIYAPPTPMSEIQGDLRVDKTPLEALKKSEQRLRSFIENICDGVYQSTPDGRFLMANPALVRILGFDSLEELLNADISDCYVHPEERKKWIRRLAEE